MNKILDQIVNYQIPCFFISPHLDDAILSAAGLISYLSDKTQTTIMTVFSQEGLPPYNLSVKAYLRQCGYNQVKLLYQQRRQEDRRACQAIGAKAIHLGFEEAMYRQKEHLPLVLDKAAKLIPEIKCLYPTYRWHVILGRLAEGDKKTIEIIRKEILKRLQVYNTCYLFAPLGVGHHVDHMIVRDVCSSLARPVIYWADEPYIDDSQPDQSFIDKNKLVLYSWGKNLTHKADMVSLYKSQFKALFPADYKVKAEQYFIPDNI